MGIWKNLQRGFNTISPHVNKAINFGKKWGSKGYHLAKTAYEKADQHTGGAFGAATKALGAAALNHFLSNNFGEYGQAAADALHTFGKSLSRKGERSNNTNMLHWGNAFYGARDYNPFSRRLRAAGTKTAAQPTINYRGYDLAH